MVLSSLNRQNEQNSIDGNLLLNIDLKSIVQKAIGGDETAFRQLYETYVERVYRHIRYRVDSNSDAEDLTQQVFIKAWKAIRRYRQTESPFVGWLLTIAHNTVVDYYRLKKPEIFLTFDVIDTKRSNDPAQFAEAEFTRKEIRQAIIKLKKIQQQVILMRYMEGFSYSEIAALTGKKEGAVRAIMHHGLKKMKSIMRVQDERNR